MLHKSSSNQKWRFRIGLQPILSPKLIFILGMMACVPGLKAQVSPMGQPESVISGTVLSEKDDQPATQVVVSLRSHAAGIFRSVLTDFAGHFEVRSLPPGKYEINVEEAGFEPAKTSAELETQPVKLVLRLKPTAPASTPSAYSVSVRELKISNKAREEFRKGLVSLQKKDWSTSLDHFTKAVKAFPDYYEAYYHQGLVETNLGQLETAMRAFQKSMDLSGGHYAFAHFGIGYVLYLEGKPQEAETVLRRGLEVDQNSADGFAILGMTLLRLNQPEEAEKCAREALLRNPNFSQAYLVLADAFAHRKMYREQLDGLETYLKLDPAGKASERVRQTIVVVEKLLADSQAPK